VGGKNEQLPSDGSRSDIQRLDLRLNTAFEARAVEIVLFKKKKRYMTRYKPILQVVLGKALWKEINVFFIITGSSL